jgi:calcineurin-like phosphoesterase family protein
MVAGVYFQCKIKTMDRRKFIRDASLMAFFLHQGQTILAADAPSLKGKKRLLRFAIASDTHFGQPKTPYQEMLDTGIRHINAMHAKDPFDFGVINGDIVHDDISFFPQAKKTLDQLAFKYYVTQGNHDMATPEQWQQAWGMPVNFDLVMGKTAIVFATTSDHTGKYLPPDMDWLKATDHLLLFIHIPQMKWTKHAIESTLFQELVKAQKNLRAVFHGHEHDQDGIKWHAGVPFLFDSHFGGNWGTNYRGYRIVELYKGGLIKTWIMNPDTALYETELTPGMSAQMPV